jgi:hypothetical protein
VELDGPAEVDALYAEIELRRRDGRLPALEEVVPAARTILIDGLADPAAFARDLSDWNVWDHSWCELEVNSGLEWRLMWRVG